MISFFLLSSLLLGALAPKGPIQVVSTLPDYASIASQIGGNRVQVHSIAKGYQDVHFVSAKPSVARLMSQADLFLTTGMDLELWAPTLIDKSRNPKIRENSSGFVSVSSGMKFLEIPRTADRSGGDIHIYGNPHIHTDPLRGLQIARNILVGLKRVDPDSGSVYQENYAVFERETYRRLFGKNLVDLVGGRELDRLAMDQQLDEFLDINEYDGKKLRAQLGGWLKLAECLRGQEILAYHKNWIYFTDRIGLRILDYVEDKPGIPPSPKHLVDLIRLVQERGIKPLLTANYYDESAPRKLEQQSGIKAVIVPLSVGGSSAVPGYFDLFDVWIGELRALYPESCQAPG